MYFRQIADHGGGADRPMGLVSGDFVFVGDVGRPDLLDWFQNWKPEAAGA